MSKLSSGPRRAVVLSIQIALLTLAGCGDDAVGPQLFAPQGVSRLLVPGIDYVHVSSGTDHTCAVRADGVVECWGDNSFGKAPASRAPVTGAFASVRAGGLHTCALRSDAMIECWGNSGTGQAPATRSAAVGGYTQIDTGTDHTCGVREDGVVECWGNNNTGKAPSTKTSAVGSFSQVDAASTHSCAVRSDGTVECWGGNSAGQAPPTRAPVASTFAQVSGGNLHTCGLRTDGGVECWGSNSGGRAPAIRTAAVGGYVQVSSGGNHTCGLRADGVVECWGSNLSGKAPPTRSATTGSFVELSAGGNHTCALRTDGVVECWGNSSDGQAPSVRRSASGSSIILPSATFVSPDDVEEGSPSTIALLDAGVPGHDGSPFTYSFDCGGGYGPFSATAEATCDGPDGPGSVEVGGIVEDVDGHTREYRSTIAVHNVAPSIGPLPESEVLVGETYVGHGSFADPGPDEHTATADFGDGTGTVPVELLGLDFTLSHTFAASGSYAVSVEVVDDDGASDTRTTAVLVLSVDDFIDRLDVYVDQLKRARILVRNQAPGLVNELRRVSRYLQRGFIEAALESLADFELAVTDIEADGGLSPAQVDTLMDGAARIRSSILASP